MKRCVIESPEFQDYLMQGVEIEESERQIEIMRQKNNDERVSVREERYRQLRMQRIVAESEYHHKIRKMR